MNGLLLYSSSTQTVVTFNYADSKLVELAIF